MKPGTPEYHANLEERWKLLQLHRKTIDDAYFRMMRGIRVQHNARIDAELERKKR